MESKCTSNRGNMELLTAHSCHFLIVIESWNKDFLAYGITMHYTILCWLQKGTIAKSINLAFCFSHTLHALTLLVSFVLHDLLIQVTL